MTKNRNLSFEKYDANKTIDDRVDKDFIERIMFYFSNNVRVNYISFG